MKKTYMVAAMLGGLLFLPNGRAQVPQLINYQGRVVTGGTNFNGTGQFKFALVNNTGLTTFWSNDGTRGGGAAPAAAVSLSVVNGLYSVLLGDATIPNMTAVPATVFTNSDVRLRIWFNDGVTGQQLLSPDQRIAAVGYAMMAADVPDGIITGNKLANNAVTSAKIADGAVTGTKLAAGGVTSDTLADTLALGQTNVNGRLDIYRTSANTPAISLLGEGNAGAILLYKTNGASTIQIYADYNGTGDGRILTQELQITGGSDLSEQFDIKSIHDALKPGMIVCIDPKNPGQLVTSTKACDRTVAGVVSGAGGVKPGMLMGQKGTQADGKHPVALTGRVYCWVDASSASIEPGDLITTSDTPGHGMKVTDHGNAQGAIIGKAMTGLAQGKGLVMILVSLQ